MPINGAAPVVAAYRIPGKVLEFWCHYCNRHHRHMAGDNPGDGDGHRVAHCKRPTPYKKTGYVLVEAGSRPKMSDD